MRSLPFSVHGVTHRGCVRDHNEDALFISNGRPLFAVADGMGGHEHGEWAAARVVEALGAVVPTGSFKRDTVSVSEAIHTANQTIFKAEGVGSAHPGATVVALMFAESRFAAFWAGDSRIYLKRNEHLVRLTRDHTHVQELLARGSLTAEEAENHPMGHVLVRVVGIEPHLRLEAVTGVAQRKDRYLLCSDGLTGMVRDEEIGEAMNEADPQKTAQSLLELALSRGAPDNTTVVAVVCEEAGKSADTPALSTSDRN
jgi:serine/threonine protein phosphatase PrpC